jgi:nicotinamide-nucleotide amidase
VTGPGEVPAVELVSIGSELLRLGRADTNAEWLAARLRGAGLRLAARCAIEDDPRRIASQIRAALDRTGRVVATGGLGPTEDDRTRDGLALALGVALERDSGEVERLRALFAARGRELHEVQLRQADRPRGTTAIPNPVGSASGIWWRSGQRWLVALPGVPEEMRAMLERSVLTEIAVAGAGLVQRSLRVAGRTESEVDGRLSPLYAADGLDVTVLASAAGVEIHAVACGPTDEIAAARADRFVAAARALLGEDCVGTDGVTLESVVGELLRRRGRTVAAAESCTAGLLGATLTSVAGSSAWFRGGVVVYANDLKIALAGVSARTLERFGAVSEEVARELARGARTRCAADYGIGVTGIAGPDGGTPDKPVGLVYVAWADPAGERVRRVVVAGDRAGIRARAVAIALDGLRRWLIEDAGRPDPRP